MIKISISDEEKRLLKDYIRTTPLVLVRYKCQAILMRSKGLALADIGDIVSRNETTVGRWIADWEERRMASIFTGHKDNQNGSKLTPEQRQEVGDVLQKPPCEWGLPKAFWDVPSLKKYIEAVFGIVYESDRSYHFLLRFSNLSFKYPDAFDARSDEAQINRGWRPYAKKSSPFFAIRSGRSLPATRCVSNWKRLPGGHGSSRDNERSSK